MKSFHWPTVLWFLVCRSFSVVMPDRWTNPRSPPRSGQAGEAKGSPGWKSSTSNQGDNVALLLYWKFGKVINLSFLCAVNFCTFGSDGSERRFVAVRETHLNMAVGLISVSSWLC